MSARDDGGPAFPRPTTLDINGYGEDGAEGMTLRDYFAAKAMQAFISAEPERGRSYLVMEAYAIADAMLAERAK